jgi:uncharacterized coiled-coil protein SlyX
LQLCCPVAEICHHLPLNVCISLYVQAISALNSALTKQQQSLAAMRAKLLQVVSQANRTLKQFLTALPPPLRGTINTLASPAPDLRQKHEPEYLPETLSLLIHKPKFGGTPLIQEAATEPVIPIPQLLKPLILANQQVQQLSKSGLGFRVSSNKDGQSHAVFDHGDSPRETGLKVAFDVDGPDDYYYSEGKDGGYSPVKVGTDQENVLLWAGGPQGKCHYTSFCSVIATPHSFIVIAIMIIL